ncbi:glycosyltransferase family 87 protein [Henriciella barbarensis]|nr:glycosyltransferase family 87 protein [Henriciella barbarensis]
MAGLSARLCPVAPRRRRAFYLADRPSHRGGHETSRAYGVFVLTAPAFAVNAAFGQNGFLTGALLYLGVRLADRRPILAGVCLGTLTIKPRLGLLIPLFLLLRGHWTVIVSAICTSIALVGLSALIFGIDMWRGYFEHVMPFQRIVAEEGTGVFLRMMPTGFALGRLQGWDASYAMALQAPFSLLALGLTVWTFRKPSAAPEMEQALLLVCVFLFSPYAFNYDMMALVPALFLVLESEIRASRSGPTRLNLMLIALFLLPVITFFLPLGPAILAGSALVLAQRISACRTEEPAPASVSGTN